MFAEPKEGLLPAEPHGKPAGRRLPPALLVLLLLFGLYRVFLTDRGALSFPDESRYEAAVAAARKLGAGELRSFCWQISSVEGRPGEGLLRLLPAAVQVGLERTGLPYWDHRSLRVPLLFNVLATLLLLLVFYRLALQVYGGDEGAALAATTFYSLLANTNVYVRHILPYDWSLLLGMAALLYAVSRSESPKPSAFAVAGLLVGAIFAVYPGYYPFAPAVLAPLLLSGGWRAAVSARGAARTALFGAGFLAVIGGFEVVARLGHTSYLGELRRLSGTITQGTFAEGFVFPLRYLSEVEGAAGWVLLAGVLAALPLAFRAGEAPPAWVRFRPVLLLLGAAFFYNCFASAVLHKMVWYGRLLHLYLPAAVLLAVFGVSQWRTPGGRRSAYMVLVGAGALSFALFAWSYQQIAYPRDAHLDHGITRPDLERAAWESPVPQQKAFGRGDGASRLLLVNPAHFWPVPAEFTPYTPPPGTETLYRAAHFLRFPAYGFEGSSVEERRRLRERPYQVGIYRLPAGVSSHGG